jgi:hypothetical protein
MFFCPNFNGFNLLKRYTSAKSVSQGLQYLLAVVSQEQVMHCPEIGSVA